MRSRLVVLLLVVGLAIAAAAQAQPAQAAGNTPPYMPKFKGDPAHSDAEAAALGYMRTLVNAQKIYHKRHDAYVTSLHQLVGQGSFTRRMEKTDRGDYTVHFRGTAKEYSLALVPRQFDSAHRAFHVDQTGQFRVEEDKAADKNSPALKQD